MNTVSTYNHDDYHVGRLQFPLFSMKHFGLRPLKALGIKLYRYFRRLIWIPSHHTMRIEHLHKGCRNIDNPSRQIFILYVKGYSMNEISGMSGTSHKSITDIVRRTLGSMRRYYN